MPNPEPSLEEFVREVRKSAKYAAISEDLVRNIATIELQKRKNVKESIKSTRNKLHQVATAFQENALPYPQWEKDLASLPNDLHSESTANFITDCLKFHSSTAERLPFLPSFFEQTLAPLEPVESILDLACGLTPLCLPWMPVCEHVTYCGIDIFSDMIGFLSNFYSHFKLQHTFCVGNIIDAIPQQKVHVAFLLKTIPCLEQVDKHIGKKLLESIPAENILVSFPSRSLGGRSKGMAANYDAHFDQLISGKNWHVARTDFPNEVTYLIRK